MPYAKVEIADDHDTIKYVHEESLIKFDNKSEEKWVKTPE